MRAAVSVDWSPPDWLGQAAAWAGSLLVAGGAKPAFDWWQSRGTERREAQKEEVDAATELREELRMTVREMRADLDKRDHEIDAVRRELYELLARIATLAAENHELRAADHRLRAWLAGFYATIQMKWKLAGLPVEDVPALPDWVTRSPSGPTASSTREPPP